MKIALLVCGQPRILNRTFLDYLDKEKINYDTFVHYWLPENNSYIQCGNSHNKHTINNINTDYLEENIKKCYNPKILKNEKKKYFKHKNMEEVTTNTICQTISQYYGIQKCFELIPNPNEYTHFIKIRFDFQFNDSNTNIKDLDNDSLYFTGYGKNKENIIDIIWIVPNIYITIFKIYDFIYSENTIFQSTPETILNKFINKFSLKRKVFDSDCTIDRSYLSNN